MSGLRTWWSERAKRPLAVAIAALVRAMAGKIPHAERLGSGSGQFRAEIGNRGQHRFARQVTPHLHRPFAIRIDKAGRAERGGDLVAIGIGGRQLVEGLIRAIDDHERQPGFVRRLRRAAASQQRDEQAQRCHGAEQERGKQNGAWGHLDALRGANST